MCRYLVTEWQKTLVKHQNKIKHVKYMVFKTFPGNITCTCKSNSTMIATINSNASRSEKDSYKNIVHVGILIV